MVIFCPPKINSRKFVQFVARKKNQLAQFVAKAETPADSGRWVYAATADVETGTTVRIAVTAEDRPGSTGTGEGEKAV